MVLFALIKKEITQFFRNKTDVLTMFVFPIILIVVMGTALNGLMNVDKNIFKDKTVYYKVEKLDVIEDTIKYILDGKYQEAIEMLVLAFYNGYIPMSILQSVLDRYEFPNGNSEGDSNEQK